MPDSATLFCLVGLPGAHKSTYAEVLRVKRSPNALVLASDDIRWTMNQGAPYKKTVEPFVRGVMENFARGCLRHGRDVIIDATNLTKRSRSEWIWWAHEVSAKAECHWVICDENESARRSAKWIPKEDIATLAASFVQPSMAEGWDKLVTVK